MVGAAEVLLISSVKFIDGLFGFLNSKQALKDGTTSSREVLELSIGRKRSVAFWTWAMIVVASFLICRLDINISKALEYIQRLAYSLIITPFVSDIVVLFMKSSKGMESAPSFQRNTFNANVPN